MFGLQQELMWDSLCLLYQSHKKEIVGHALRKFEIRLMDALMKEQKTNRLAPILDELRNGLEGADLFVIWCDFS